MLLDIFIRHQETIKKEFYTRHSGLSADMQDNEWIDHIFKSQGLKKLITLAEVEQVSQVFPDNLLNNIITRSNLKSAVTDIPDMLNNLFPLAPPEKWLNAYSKGNFNINKFFDNKFKRGFAQSLLKDYKGTAKYPYVQKVILDELDYLGPALKTVKIKEEDLISFWRTVLLCDDIPLFKGVARNLPLPDRLSNAGQKFFDKSFDNRSIGQPKVSCVDIYREVQYEIMQEKLVSKSVGPKKKLKI